jgi:hypothetical protein
VLQRYLKVDSESAFDGERELESKEPVLRPESTIISRRQIEIFYSRVYSRERRQGNRPFALIDPRNDILFLQDPPHAVYQTGVPVVSSLEILVRWLDPEIIANVRRLAIPYYSLRKTRVLGHLEVLMEFKGLNELCVSFLGGYDGQRRLWSDEVGDLGGHMNEVEKEISGDLESLEKEFPGWERPALKFVKHRGLLIDQLEA